MFRVFLLRDFVSIFIKIRYVCLISQVEKILFAYARFRLNT